MRHLISKVTWMLRSASERRSRKMSIRFDRSMFAICGLAAPRHSETVSATKDLDPDKEHHVT